MNWGGAYIYNVHHTLSPLPLSAQASGFDAPLPPTPPRRSSAMFKIYASYSDARYAASSMYEMLANKFGYARLFVSLHGNAISGYVLETWTADCVYIY